MSLGEENRVPRLRLVLQEINPQPIIRHQKLPRLAHRSQLRRLPGAKDSENLHENVDRNPVELAGRRSLRTHELEEAVVLRRPVRAGTGARARARGGGRSVGDGSPNLPNESAHGRLGDDLYAMCRLNFIPINHLLLRIWQSSNLVSGGRSLDDLRKSEGDWRKRRFSTRVRRHNPANCGTALQTLISFGRFNENVFHL